VRPAAAGAIVKSCGWRVLMDHAATWGAHDPSASPVLLILNLLEDSPSVALERWPQCLAADPFLDQGVGEEVAADLIGGTGLWRAVALNHLFHDPLAQ
jgi:hypothetical protein